VKGGGRRWGMRMGEAEEKGSLEGEGDWSEGRKEGGEEEEKGGGDVREGEGGERKL